MSEWMNDQWQWLVGTFALAVGSAIAFATRTNARARSNSHRIDEIEREKKEMRDKIADLDKHHLELKIKFDSVLENQETMIDLIKNKL